MRRRDMAMASAIFLAAPVMGCATVWSWRHPPHDQGTLVVNVPSDAKWTGTTLESATTPPQRQRLRNGRPRTLRGEIVDVSCYLQLGKRGEAHIPCGQQCIRFGAPIGLVTDDGTLYLVMPEEHHPRRDGSISIKEKFAELVGKRVEISGMVTISHNSRAIFIRSVPAER